MKTKTWLRTSLGALMLGALWLPAAWADFELKDGQGRTILLKDDGTWRYLEAPAASGAASAPAKEQPQAELLLERRMDAPGGCRFELTLVNTLTYEIRSLVPEFAVYRANDVAYSAQTASFGPVRPGDRSRRALQFIGIACTDIARLQVQGGDRCEMGDLNKFSDAKGQCLARVRVVPSELLRFEKGR
ncbi:MAG: hypothetical protein IH627_23635 [Rubrivivax sp.]|nr:hypothetical protein [Rubrivivax sp.]